MDSFILEAGTTVLSWRAMAAFLILVNISAIGSVTIDKQLRSLNYQLDFLTPGNSPFSASLRKHIRQMPNFLIYARGLPHRRQR
jgi:hypothetical protein